MALKDFTEFVEPLTIPIRGKVYTIPPVSTSLGLKLTLVAEHAATIFQVVERNQEAARKAAEAGEEPPEPEPLPEFELEDDEAEEDLQKKMLGNAYDQMVEDDVPFMAIKIAGMTAYHDFLYGREAAEAFWNSGGDPKAVAQTWSESTGSTMSTDEATTTKRPASTSGTKPRKKK